MFMVADKQTICATHAATSHSYALSIHMHLFGKIVFPLPAKLNRSVSCLRLPEHFWLLSRGAARTLSISRQPGTNNDTIITGIHQSPDKLFQKYFPALDIYPANPCRHFLSPHSRPGDSWRKAVQWQISCNYQYFTTHKQSYNVLNKSILYIAGVPCSYVSRVNKFYRIFQSPLDSLIYVFCQFTFLIIFKAFEAFYGRFFQIIFFSLCLLHNK